MVLFSAVVVQWVTSRDNAGSSSQVNSAALDNSYVGRQSSAAHQMSSMRASKAPNNSHDMDDEANLVSSGAVAFSSDNGSDVTKISSGVVVTTTIHRQIKPTPGREGSLLDDDIETIGESDRDFPLRPAVYSPDKMDASEPTQTHIQGGRVQHQRTKTLSFSRPMN
ncbi:hypothetical protein ACHAPM_002192 [Fusarium culmorum]